MRKLAEIVEIDAIHPIKDADKIETATLKNKAWQCVVGKGEFQPNDYAVYFEVDSFLPKSEPYMFLEGRCNRIMDGVEGYRLKTIKLRGTLSQGMLMPLDKFTEPKFDRIRGKGVGSDVTDILGVKLYEAPIPACLAGEAKGSFPSFLSKSDQERLQNLPEYFEMDFMQGVEFEATLKMDGTSVSVFYNNAVSEPEDMFGVCSRNLQLKEKEGNTYWDVVNGMFLKERMICLGKNLMIQAEICGEGIQGNHSKLKGHQMFVYDVFDIDKYKYLKPSDRLGIIAELCEPEVLMHVPVIGKYRIFNMFRNFEDLHEWVTQQKGMNGTVPEGVVFKSVEPVDGQVISFKVINNKYLLKYEE